MALTAAADGWPSNQYRCWHGIGHPRPGDAHYSHQCDRCCTTYDVRDIVISPEFGGPELSSEAIDMLRAEGLEILDAHMFPRDDVRAVRLVQEHPDIAGAPIPLLRGRRVRFAVVTIPADVSWQIAEHDGAEWVAEQHREWRETTN